MNVRILAAALVIGLAAPVIVFAESAPFQDDQDALARARAAHRAALKSHDKAAIAKTAVDLRKASSALTQDRQNAAAEAAPLAAGETREVRQALLKAREDHQDALASGDPVAIKRTGDALRIASHNDGAVRNHKPSAKP